MVPVVGAPRQPAQHILGPELGQLDLDALTVFARPVLAGYKVPRRILFVDRIPRLPNGKIDYASAAGAAQTDALGCSADPTT